jgi:hypothetical protein
VVFLVVFFCSCFVFTRAASELAIILENRGASEIVAALRELFQLDPLSIARRTKKQHTATIEPKPSSATPLSWEGSEKSIPALTSKVGGGVAVFMCTNLSI